MNKKILSVLLALSLVLTAISVPAFAADQSVPVDLTVETPIFSVTVPTSLPITLTDTGDVQVATDATIINNSAGPIKISGIQTKGANGWATVAHGSLDIKTAKVDSKNVGLSLNIGTTTIKTTGADSNDFSGSISLIKGQTLPLIYDAKLAAQKTAVASTQIAEVIFTVGWDD